MDWEFGANMDIERTRTQRLVNISDNWLMRAIEQKNAHLTVGVACSELLVYDQLDRQLLTLIANNEKN